MVLLQAEINIVQALSRHRPTARAPAVAIMVDNLDAQSTLAAKGFTMLTKPIWRTRKSRRLATFTVGFRTSF